MEAVYKKGSKFFGMTSGLMYTPDEVHETHDGCYWHEHGVGMPVIEVGELEGKDTRTHGGFPQYPSQGKEHHSTDIEQGKGVVRGKKGL